MATKRVEFMTKDELKKELRRFDVDFAPTMNKDYYIKLYKENCLKRSTKFSEFSSDEELSSKSPRKTKKKTSPEVPSSIRSLSDKDLAKELKKYNITGPVTETTRKLYEKKLTTLRRERESPRVNVKVNVITRPEQVDSGEFSSEESSGEIGEDSGEEQADSGSGIPLVAQYRPEEREQERRRDEGTSRRRPLSQVSNRRADKPARVFVPTGPSRSARQTSSSSRSEDGGSWSMCFLQVLVALLVVVMTVVFISYVTTGKWFPISKDDIANLLE